MVAVEATDRDSYKQSNRNEVVALLEMVNKTQVLYLISDKVGIIIDFDNLKARFGLNLYAKDYADHKGVDDSMLSLW